MRGKFKGNQKVRNATKTVVDGVKYDSKLEAYMAGLLKMLKIPFDFQVKYELQPGFKYKAEKFRIQAITLTVDFVLHDRRIIIDTKGYANDVAPVKLKMLKYKLALEGNEYAIYLPSTQKECQALVAEWLKPSA